MTIERYYIYRTTRNVVYARSRDGRCGGARGGGIPAAADSRRARGPQPAGRRAVHRAQRRILVRSGDGTGLAADDEVHVLPPPAHPARGGRADQADPGRQGLYEPAEGRPRQQVPRLDRLHRRRRQRTRSSARLATIQPHGAHGMPAASTAARRPRVAPGGTGGRIRQWQPTQIEPLSASRLLPTISLRSGGPPSRSDAVRHGSRSRLAMPRSQERTKVVMKASRPVPAYPMSMDQPVLLTIPMGRPAP